MEHLSLEEGDDLSVRSRVRRDRNEHAATALTFNRSLLTEIVYLLPQIEYTQLPVGKFVEIQVQSTDFFNLTDLEAVLECKFRDFACLTANETIPILYKDR